MPTKDHPVGLEPSSHGKSAKGFYNPPRVTACPPPASPAGGPVATHASDPTTRSTAPTPSLGVHSFNVTAPTPTTHSTTGPPSDGKEKKKRKKGRDGPDARARAAARQRREVSEAARLFFAVARRERLGPFMIIGTLPYRGGSAAYEAAEAADRRRRGYSDDEDPWPDCGNPDPEDDLGACDCEGYCSDDAYIDTTFD